MTNPKSSPIPPRDHVQLTISTPNVASSSAQYEIPEPPTDAISAVRFAPAPSSSHRLLVSSWDRHVRLYDVAAGGGSRLVRSFEHRAPVLDACWGGANDGDNGGSNEKGEASTAYSVGLDGDVRAINLGTGAQTVLSTHSEPASKVVYSARHRLLISASWDKTLHVHKFGRRRGGDDDDDGGDDDSDDNGPKVITIPLPAKPFALGLSPSKLVVAMAGRANSIYDLAALGLFADQDDGTSAVETGGSNVVEAAPWQKRESSLKYMTRAVACMPDDRGYATSSIEGRVAVEWFADDAATQDKKYAFKCHRQAASAADAAGGDGDEKAAAAADIVYPVNVLAFHPQYGTFASGGGDGVVSVWDAAAKKRIRNYAKLGASVAGLDWSADGRWLAIGVSPGFEDGKEFPPGSSDMVVKVLVRELADGEAKAKAK